MSYAASTQTLPIPTAADDKKAPDVKCQLENQLTAINHVRTTVGTRLSQSNGRKKEKRVHGFGNHIIIDRSKSIIFLGAR